MKINRTVLMFFKYCKDCRKQLNNLAKYCKYCGSRNLGKGAGATQEKVKGRVL